MYTNKHGTLKSKGKSTSLTHASHVSGGNHHILVLMVTKKAEVVALMVIGVVDGGGLASYEGEMRGALFVTGLSLFTLPFIFVFLSSYTFTHLLLSLSFLFSIYFFIFIP
jgi:hypothetical protein